MFWLVQNCDKVYEMRVRIEESWELAKIVSIAL